MTEVSNEARLVELVTIPHRPDEPTRQKYPTGSPEDIAYFLFITTNNLVGGALDDIDVEGKSSLPREAAKKLRDDFGQAVTNTYGSRADLELVRTSKILAHRLTKKRLEDLMDIAEKRARRLNVVKEDVSD